MRALVAVELDGCEIALHLRDEFLRALGPAHELAEVADGVVYFREVPRVHGPDIDAGLDEIGGELVLHVGGGDDEVGLELEDGFEVAGIEAADLRLGRRTFRLAIERRHACDLRPDAEAIEDVRTIRAKGNEALGAGSA